MKSLKIFSVVLAFGLIFSGIGLAGVEEPQGSAEIAAQADPSDIMEQAALPESIELTGMVLSDNTFVDENGDNYQLSNSETNEELLDYVGHRIKVKATVMESDEGLRNISVTDYEILKD
jgi:hypothetical protein